MQWFLSLMEELGIECQVSHPAKIRDADLILKLLMENRFPSIWRPSKELVDLRALLLHRYPVEGSSEQDFLIREATEEVRIPATAIATIDTVKPTFWRQLQGSLDMGYSFTSGNHQSTLNVDTKAAYKTPRLGECPFF